MDKDKAKLALGLDPDSFLVLWVGRLSRPQKDAFTVITAVKKIGLEGINVKLIIVGQGKDEKALREFADDRDNSIKSNISFKTDFIKHEDLQVYYNAADVFVLNSSHEGMPQVALEAMACKTPVILSDVPGNREIALDVGLIFPQSNLEILTECIAKLIKNEPLRKSLGEKGYQKVIECYTWDRITRTIVENIYRRLTDSR